MNKQIPALRFPQFAEHSEWEEKKLGEVGKINPANKKLPENFIYIDLESVESGKLLKETQINKNEAPSRAQRVLEKNDILFQMVRPYQMNNLFFDKVGDYVASTGYAQIRTKQNARFVYHFLHFQKFVDNVIEKCTGTSYPAINSTDLSNIKISLPSLPEQNAIADFLSAVDKRILLLKQRHELLQSYKKGIMQQIFSQELRFKDDAGQDFPEWEEKTLGEICKIQSGLSAEQNSFSKGYPVTRIETISEGKINLERIGYAETANSIEFYKLKIGDILFSNINSVVHIGKTAFVDKELNLYHGMNLLRLISTINSKFLYYFLNLEKTRAYFRTICNQAVSQASINQTELGKTIIPLPCLAEQKKIAEFLTAIDDKIEKTGQQIAQNEEWKRGLLQRMLV